MLFVAFFRGGMSKTSPTPLAYAHWYDRRKSTRDLGSGAGSASLRRRVSCTPFHCVCAPTTPDLPPLAQLHPVASYERRHPGSPRPCVKRGVLEKPGLRSQPLGTPLCSVPTTDLLGSGVVGPYWPDADGSGRIPPLTPPSGRCHICTLPLAGCYSYPLRDIRMLL